MKGPYFVSVVTSSFSPMLFDEELTRMSFAAPLLRSIYVPAMLRLTCYVS